MSVPHVFVLNHRQVDAMVETANQKRAQQEAQSYKTMQETIADINKRRDVAEYYSSEQYQQQEAARLANLRVPYPESARQQAQELRERLIEAERDRVKEAQEAAARAQVLL